MMLHVSHFYMMWGSFIKSNYAKIYVYSQFHFPHKWLFFFYKIILAMVNDLWSNSYDMDKEIITYTFCCVCVCVSFCRILLVNDMNSKVFGFVLWHLLGEYF